MSQPSSNDDRGLYNKFVVYRRHDPEGKHARCPYFVLDLKHDKWAAAALRAYADACEKEQPLLARDLRDGLPAETIPGGSPPSEEDTRPDADTAALAAAFDSLHL